MFGLFKKQDSETLLFKQTIKGILGATPKNLTVYQLAFKHSSLSEESNERLEFLGDAILGAIVADYLFKKYPFKDEGFLTEIRSRIVKRDSLNTLALKLGFDKIIKFHKGGGSYRSIYGNALEAFIGAVYLDQGYKFTYTFIVNQLISPHLNIKDIVENNRNFKSILIEWCQKNDKKISFSIANEEGENHKKEFTANAFIDNEIVGTGKGYSKKKAEQSAAEKVCSQYNLN